MEEILTDIIDKLPSLQQMIIKMKDIHNYEVDEIAHITGTTAKERKMENRLECLPLLAECGCKQLCLKA